MVAIGEPARITYTNYRGETAERTITPKRAWYGISEWHPEPQWFLTAFDHDKNADRDFALIDFGHSRPCAARELALEPDWINIAKMAGKFGIRYQTNHELVDFLKAIRDLSSPDHADAGKVHEYVQGYEFRADNGGGYTPTDGERTMIEDAIQGFISDAGKAEGDGWRPIESAPNNNAILVHYDDGNIELISADDNMFSWIAYTVKEDFCTKPTHWRPLPLPPVEGGKND